MSAKQKTLNNNIMGLLQMSLWIKISRSKMISVGEYQMHWNLEKDSEIQNNVKFSVFSIKISHTQGDIS